MVKNTLHAMKDGRLRDFMAEQELRELFISILGMAGDFWQILVQTPSGVAV